MAWIESHDEIWEHHKTIVLCRALGIGKAQAVGHLHALWHFTLRNAWKNADLTPWGDAEIERVCFWEGEKGAFVNALRECGFLDGFTVHGWQERAGRLVYDRLRKEKDRKSAIQRRTNGGKSKATVPYRTLPNPTQPNPTITPAQAPKVSSSASRFEKPTAAEVTAYAASIGFKLDGERFCAFYESKGWVIGKSPMKSWKAAVVTWKKDAHVSALILPPKPKVQEVELSDEDRQAGLQAMADIKKIMAGAGKEIPR